MKPETEIRNLKRELRAMQRERDKYNTDSRNWKAAYLESLDRAEAWERRFDALLHAEIQPKVAD